MAIRSILAAVTAATPIPHHRTLYVSGIVSSSGFTRLLIPPRFSSSFRAFSSANSSDYSLQPPDVLRLAETARINLSPQEVEEFTPKIRQVVDWLGQLQGVELQSIEPALRAVTEDDHLRDDVPEQFENKEAIISSIPSYDEPFIRVPKVLNKE
ncbi:hypothetical protein MLD38_006363 [Melastoma candidum]|uniref:Uncharacterized protein n=1 Tax=Melastoma candidum TaxID=119954 RepID=A0ACB9RMM1_9MYRT|nr:hypothetical protein MLD38_006363 [Melastoma candidum]